MVQTRAQRAGNTPQRQTRSAPQTRSATKKAAENGTGKVTSKKTDEVAESPKQLQTASKSTIIGAVVVALISYFTLPDSLQPVGRPTLQHVWYYGWISALSTGLGVVPLIFAPDLDKFWVGVSNGELFSLGTYSCTYVLYLGISNHFILVLSRAICRSCLF